MIRKDLFKIKDLGQQCLNFGQDITLGGKAVKDPLLVIAYDVGTTGLKTCLYAISSSVRLLGSEMSLYNLYILPNGGAEQDPLDWWSAMCSTTGRLLQKTGTDPASIKGITFCSQMQALVLVDRKGNPLRRAMTYMDQRAHQELRETMSHGLQLSGINLCKLLNSLRETGAVSASVKDPVWKYRWVKKHEPDLFAKTFKWLDAKEFLIARCSDRYIMTEDSAYATLLYGIRKGRRGWSEKICAMLGVNTAHLAEIKQSTDQVGVITAEAAAQLGLAEGTAVFGGGGDASLIGIGAGCINEGETHIYAGTSGWVSTVVEKPVVDILTMIAAIVGAQPGKYNYFAEMETAGKCLEWARDNLALDQIGIYDSQSPQVASPETRAVKLYDYLTAAASQAAPGSGGVIFTPWLHGNRCPFEDSRARGIFFNIGLETGKRELLRAVIEGVCYHLRWMLEAQEKKINTSKTIRFVGGGALSAITCQILADLTGRTVETVDNPQNAGAVGAALLAGLGFGAVNSFTALKDMIPASGTFHPDPRNKLIYDSHFHVFKKLYQSNKKHFQNLNEPGI